MSADQPQQAQGDHLQAQMLQQLSDHLALQQPPGGAQPIPEYNPEDVGGAAGSGPNGNGASAAAGGTGERPVPDQRNKLFVGGLSRNTSDEAFRGFFSQFGEMSDCVVMREKGTGVSRGFGFVTFMERDAVERVLASKSLELDGRRIDCKLAIPQEQMDVPPRFAPGGTSSAPSSGRPHAPPQQRQPRKLYVGGLSLETTTAQLEHYFSQFGRLSEATVMLDRVTGKARGFGFVTFVDDNGADRAVAEKRHMLDGRQLEVERSRPPREEIQSSRDSRSGPASSSRRRSRSRSPRRGGGGGGGGGDRSRSRSRSRDRYESDRRRGSRDDRDGGSRSRYDGYEGRRGDSGLSSSSRYDPRDRSRDPRDREFRERDMGPPSMPPPQQQPPQGYYREHDYYGGAGMAGPPRYDPRGPPPVDPRYDAARRDPYGAPAPRDPYHDPRYPPPSSAPPSSSMYGAPASAHPSDRDYYYAQHHTAPPQHLPSGGSALAPGPPQPVMRQEYGAVPDTHHSASHPQLGFGAQPQFASHYDAFGQPTVSSNSNPAPLSTSSVAPPVGQPSQTYYDPRQSSAASTAGAVAYGGYGQQAAVPYPQTGFGQAPAAAGGYGSAYGYAPQGGPQQQQQSQGYGSGPAGSVGAPPQPTGADNSYSQYGGAMRRF